MQVTKTHAREESDFSLPLTIECFNLLLAAASPRGRDISQIQKELGLDSARFEKVLTELQEGYMLDVVSYLDGRHVRETLRLTEHGVDTLVKALSCLAELPERLV